MSLGFSPISSATVSALATTIPPIPYVDAGITITIDATVTNPLLVLYASVNQNRRLIFAVEIGANQL